MQVKVKQIKIEPPVGMRLRDAAEEAIWLATRYNCEAVLEFNTVDLYIRPGHRPEEIEEVYKAFSRVHKKRVLADDEAKQFRVVQIVGVTAVRGVYTQKPGYMGFLAKDDRGHIYTNSWYDYADDARRPYALWWGEDALWWDVIWGDFYKEREQIASKFPQLFGYCKEHNQLFYKDRECPFCAVE